MNENMCRIPVSATFTVVKGRHTPVMTSADYVDISADAIAKFLLERCGADAIFGEEVKD